MQPYDPRADLQARSEFFLREWFREVIIRTGLQAFDHAIGAPTGGEQDDINEDVRLSDALTNFEAIHAGHHPIDHRKRGRGLGAQCLHCFAAVARGNHAVTEAFKRRNQQFARDRVVLGDDDR